MEHRHVHGTFQPDLNEHEQHLNRNNVMPLQMLHGCFGISGSNRVPYPVENRFLDQRPLCPNWNHSTICNWHYDAHYNNSVQHHQPVAASLHHPYPPFPTSGYLPTFPRNCVYSSSNMNPPGFCGNGPSYDDFTMGERGSYKRKGPAFPFVDAIGSSQGYYAAGSSSIGHIYPNVVQDMPYFNSTGQRKYHAKQIHNHFSHSRPVVDEGTSRNVRRRFAYEEEANTNVSGSYLQFPGPKLHPTGCSIPAESTHGITSCVNLDWRHSHMPYAGPGMTPVEDLRNSTQGNNLLLSGSTSTDLISEVSGYQNYFDGSRNPFGLQSSFGNPTRPTQVVPNYLCQYPQSYWNTHNAYGPRPSHDTSHLVSENYSSTRHPRPFHRAAFVPTGVGRVPRIHHERYRFLPSDTSDPNGPMSEGFIDVGRSAVQGFQNIVDQHIDMRLDVDNMTYEELLVLGERIGSVCTGLSVDAVSKCLTEAVHHCSSIQGQEEEICAICLEEYKNMDSIGTLDGCGHGYHCSCIKKWLSIKNSCPICKAPGLSADDLDDRD